MSKLQRNAATKTSASAFSLRHRPGAFSFRSVLRADHHPRRHDGPRFGSSQRGRR